MKRKVMLFMAALFFLFMLFSPLNRNEALAGDPVFYEDNTFTQDNVKFQILTEPAVNEYGTCIIIGPAHKNIKRAEINEIVGYREDIKNAYRVVDIKEGAFKNCKKLKVVEQGESDFNLTTVPKDCFYGCKNLTKVYFESPALEKIDKRAFKGCRKLSYISLESKHLKKSSFKKSSFSGVPAGLSVEGANTKYSNKYAGYLQKCGVKNPKPVKVENNPPKDDWGEDWGSD